MNIKRIDDESDPGYPSIDKHKVNRRSALKAMVGGLAAVGLVGCREEPPVIMGEMAMPLPPEQPPAQPPEATPVKPIETPDRPDVKGDMPAPRRPDPPALGGVMVAPNPPMQGN